VQMLMKCDAHIYALPAAFTSTSNTPTTPPTQNVEYVRKF